MAGKTSKYLDITLSYLQGLFEKVSGIPKLFIMKIAPHNFNDVSHLLKSAKDPILLLDTADVVYNILYHVQIAQLLI